MEDKDYIKELFSEKLRNQEAPVNPELWSSISASITSSAAVSTGLSLFAKLAIGISAAAVVVSVITYVALQDSPQKIEDKKEQNSNTTPVDKKQDVQTNSDDPKSEVLALDPNEQMVGNTYHDASPYPVNEPENFVVKDEFSEIPRVEENTNGHTPTPDQINPSNVKNEVPEPEITNPGNTEIGGAEKPPVQQLYTLGKLPNVFSPNGDNIDEEFLIESSGLIDFSLTIINDKGQTVFSTQDPNFRWDGRDLSNQKVPAGEYVYFFVARDQANNTVNKSSSLTVCLNQNCK